MALLVPLEPLVIQVIMAAVELAEQLALLVLRVIQVIMAAAELAEQLAL